MSSKTFLSLASWPEPGSLDGGTHPDRRHAGAAGTAGAGRDRRPVQRSDDDDHAGCGTPAGRMP